MSPIVPLFALVFTGALVGFVIALPPLLGVVAVACTMVIARTSTRAPRALLLAFAAVATGASAAVLAKAHHDAQVAQLPLGERVVVEGVVGDVQETRTGGRRVQLQASGLLRAQEALAVSVQLQVSLPARVDRVALTPGDRVRLRGRLRAFEPADFPGQFDAARFGLARSWHARLSVWQAEDILVVEPQHETALFAQTRLALRRQLMDLLTPTEAGVVLALLIGDTSLFDEAQLQLYRRVGAGHLLAVSGLQVSLLALVLARAGLVALLCIPAIAGRGLARRAAAILAVFGVWCFIGLCGAPPSAVRAAAMSTAVLSAEILSLPRLRGLDALGIAGLLTVLWHPPVVLDPSFLLSYAAVVGLIAGVAPPPNEDTLPTPSPGRPWWRAARRGALATLGAGALTLPISAHLFGEVSPGGVIANLVLVPAAALLQLPAIGLGLLGALTGSATAAGLGAACAGLIEALCAGLDPWLGGLIAVEAPSGGQTFALTTAALLFVIGLTRGRRRLLWPVAAAVGVTVTFPTWIQGPALRITALPVGQGDGTVFEFPSGQVMLIDGGGVYDEHIDPGVRVVLPYLRRRHIEHVDVIVGTHPHPDHLLGLLAVLAQHSVGELWHPGYDHRHPLMARVLTLAAARGVVVREAKDLLGRHPFGDAVVEVLAPAPGEGQALYEELHANDNSLVLRVRYGDDAALWTGDIERWGERYLVSSGAELRASVVKAPHHGSRTSSSEELIAASGAAHVVFTVGRGNQWGFPHPEVADRWAEAGARLWDTATHGEITFRLSGKGVQAETYR